MKLIYEREKLVKSIPLMALMAAINIIIAELSALTPLFSIFLILILPLTSAIVELCCKDRYFPIYALATFGLALALTFWNIETTIFYVFPSIVTGYLFGLLAKHKIPTIWSIFAATLAQTGITYGLIPFINFIFQVDMVETFKVAFGLAKMNNVDIIVPTFIFLISLIQSTLSQLIVIQELQKFGIKDNNKHISDIIAYSLGIGFALLIIPFYFINLKFAYFYLAISIYFATYALVIVFKEKDYLCLIPAGVALLITILLFALLQSYLKEASQFLLFGILSACICLISLVFSFLKKKKEKIQ